MQQGLSPLGALWKAKKYILFDLRFGSLGNCPGTLFTAHKSCLPRGKGNVFYTQKMLTSPLLKPSSPIPFLSLSLEQELRRCEGMASGHRGKWFQGNKMSSGLVIWDSQLNKSPLPWDSLFSTRREKCSQWPPGWIWVLILNLPASLRKKRGFFFVCFVLLLFFRISSLMVRWRWQVWFAQPPSALVNPSLLARGAGTPSARALGGLEAGGETSFLF